MIPPEVFVSYRESGIFIKAIVAGMVMARRLYMILGGGITRADSLHANISTSRFVFFVEKRDDPERYRL